MRMSMLALPLLASLGCPTPPSFGGSTDVSATNGAPSTGSTEGAPESATGEVVTGDEPDAVADHRTYFLAESVTFNGFGFCEQGELNTVTKRLKDRLDDAGWKGLRLVDAETVPEDFWEGTEQPDGRDGTRGDAFRFSVYAGHGLPGLLSWGSPSPAGECFTDIREQSRLGRFSGDTAQAVMLLTSCTMDTSILWPNFELNASRQVFGFHNSPFIAGREPRDVFKRTQDGQATKDAWLDEMEDNAALGKNSPVALTVGVVADEAVQFHTATNLASGEGFLESVGEPVKGHHFEWLNNGCTPDCNLFCGDFLLDELPGLTPGTELPVVAIERPQRTADALVERAAMVVSVLQGRPASSPQRAELNDWARSVLASGDVSVVMLPGTNTLQVAYEPELDRLVVDDLTAREAARPGASELPDAGRRAAELDRATAVRDQALPELSGLLGLSHEVTFTVGTREAGTIEGGVSTGSIPFEYIFSTFGEFAGYPVIDARLELGVTRTGALSRIAVSSVDIQQVTSAVVARSPIDALHALGLEIAAQNPGMLRHHVVVARVGFATSQDSASVDVVAPVAPRLLADYVVVYPGDGVTPFASRRLPVSVPLDDPSAPVPIEDIDAPDEQGEGGHEAPANP
jgi:hypothetical protein